MKKFNILVPNIEENYYYNNDVVTKITQYKDHIIDIELSFKDKKILNNVQSNQLFVSNKNNLSIFNFGDTGKLELISSNDIKEYKEKDEITEAEFDDDQFIMKENIDKNTTVYYYYNEDKTLREKVFYKGEDFFCRHIFKYIAPDKRLTTIEYYSDFMIINKYEKLINNEWLLYKEESLINGENTRILFNYDEKNRLVNTKQYAVFNQ